MLQFTVMIDISREFRDVGVGHRQTRALTNTFRDRRDIRRADLWQIAFAAFLVAVFGWTVIEVGEAPERPGTTG